MIEGAVASRACEGAASNTRVQRTRSSPSALRSPLMRCPLGGRKLSTGSLDERRILWATPDFVAQFLSW
jgi:hypothetical protein